MLLSLAPYGMYREQGPSFVPRYEALLAGGGSQAPRDLLKPLGVDISDKAFWRMGFRVIEEMMAELEKS